MAEESWHQARLIPTSGINGPDEQERRATSALLAVVGAVREFGVALTRPIGAPAASLETFIEVPFEVADQRLFPDGLIRARRGAKTWTCLVEVKTGTNMLDAAQIESYLDIAREQSFDSVLTVSNEIPALAGMHPTKIDKRKLRRVALHHYSWSQVLALAVVQKEHRGVRDPDQAWILGELIRYLEHPRSGALEFEDMGSSWVQVREAVAASTLRASDDGAADVAARFDALLRYVSLQLGRRLGDEVVPLLSRKDVADPAGRTSALAQSLSTSGILHGAIRIPGTPGPLVFTADLRANQVTCHIDIDAPREGRPATRVKWLLRQLKDAPPDLRLEAYAAHARGHGSAGLLKLVREDPSSLTLGGNKDLKSFRIAMTVSMGSKRGRGRGSFIDSSMGVVESFYGSVLAGLKAWTPNPAKLRDNPEATTRPESLSSTALSSQDGADAQPVAAVSGP